MTTYHVHLESGPQRRRTMVHVLELLGCTANGPTTEEALAATPEAVQQFGAFLKRHGESFDARAAVHVKVEEHITKGEWLGNGSPYLVFADDLKPLSDVEIDTLLARFAAMASEFGGWAATQPAPALDAKPAGGGRTARAMVLHAVGSPGAYLSAALGGAPGFSRIVTLAERGELPLQDAWSRVAELVESRVRQTTPEQRRARRVLGGGARVYTLRKAMRRTLEHTWEHLAELSRRPGGPKL